MHCLGDADSILTEGEDRDLESALGTQTSGVLATVAFRQRGSRSATACGRSRFSVRP